MRVTVAVERCGGAGQCARTAPQVFDQDEDSGTVVLLDDRPPPHLDGAVRLAAQLCPNSVIQLMDSQLMDSPTA
jgi:ferredoxin